METRKSERERERRNRDGDVRVIERRNRGASTTHRESLMSGLEKLEPDYRGASNISCCFLFFFFLFNTVR